MYLWAVAYICTYQIQAHFPNVFIFAHGLEFSGRFNKADGLEL
jgi:hypothetical protein